MCLDASRETERGYRYYYPKDETAVLRDVGLGGLCRRVGSCKECIESWESTESDEEFEDVKGEWEERRRSSRIDSSTIKYSTKDNLINELYADHIEFYFLGC